MNSFLNPKCTVAELKELRMLTGNEHGAQRVAFTQTWLDARAWLRNKLSELPVEVRTDAAGNLWATLAGAFGKFYSLTGTWIPCQASGLYFFDGCGTSCWINNRSSDISFFNAAISVSF